jgi:hypothetical protein
MGDSCPSFVSNENLLYLRAQTMSFGGKRHKMQEEIRQGWGGFIVVEKLSCGFFLTNNVL